VSKILKSTTLLNIFETTHTQKNEPTESEVKELRASVSFFPERGFLMSDS